MSTEAVKRSLLHPTFLGFSNSRDPPMPVSCPSAFSSMERSPGTDVAIGTTNVFTFLFGFYLKKANVTDGGLPSRCTHAVSSDRGQHSFVLWVYDVNSF